MILLVLLLGLGGTWVILPRLQGSSETYVIGLIFTLTALAVVVQGVSDAYTSKQARLRREALARTEGWPRESEDEGDPTGEAGLTRDRMATRMEGRNLSGERGDRE